ncbi:MAG TPA: hypothetical protein PLI74_06435, partial [Candidatus Kapabacteria bacterium]|nr:hypothetical protein [Candidatus Kapabacteria bacterium]
MKKSILSLCVFLSALTLLHAADDNFTKGKELLKKRKFIEAEHALRKAIESQPNSAEIYNELAIT